MKYNASTLVYGITGTHLNPSFFVVECFKNPIYYKNSQLTPTFKLTSMYKSLILKQTKEGGGRITPSQVRVQI